MDNSIGIYIHIPFCKSKCYYCDFNSYSGREYLVGSYFDALLSEMKNSAELLSERPVRTIFIGGGTPSLVDPKYISSLLEVCSKYFKVNAEAEISMESNPGTLTYDSLKAYRAAGVNRLSMGLQAWQDRLLKDMGRIHCRQQFVDNLEAAFKAGFQNINADLIFGLPGQTFEDWVETLEAVTALAFNTGRGLSVGTFAGLSHLSCYSLKIEEDTNFGDRLDEGTLVAADDELDRRMYRYTVEFLARKGYKHYEISNFAKPGFECRHNLVYWKALEYAGFGAGAHSYLNHRRFSNAAGIEEYMEAVRQTGANCEGGQHKDIQFIDWQEAMSEFMILGLRLIDGVCANEFQTRFGESLQAVYGDTLEKLVKEGLLAKRKNRYDEACSHNSGSRIVNAKDNVCFNLTTLGLDFANSVFVEFI